MNTEAPGVMVVTAKYPAASETFINRELAALRATGLRVRVVNTYPVDVARGEADPEIPVLECGVGGSLVGLLRFLVRPHRFPRMLAAFWRIRQAATPRKARVAAATFLRILGEIPPRDRQVCYAHYLNTPTLTALLLSIWDGTPYLASAHAYDIFQSRPEAVALAAGGAEVVFTCCARNLGALEERGVPGAELVRHGVVFPEVELPPPTPEPGAPVELVTVARLVPKKAHDRLLQVAARLRDQGLEFRWSFVGEGPEAESLRGLCRQAGLGDRIRWLGALAHQECLATMAAAEVFVYWSQVTEEGDRDGVPNVLAEALVRGTPVVSVDFDGAGELAEILGENPMLTRTAPEVEALAAAVAARVQAGVPDDASRADAAARLRQAMDGERAAARIGERLRAAVGP